ncbi:MAG: outer membrane lipoprotein chaperone LolA [Bdellovibrionales bacterium]|nr:outer membrane lipoprotein chaperone LolA [Bdellovibrionales bacterium]
MSRAWFLSSFSSLVLLTSVTANALSVPVAIPPLLAKVQAEYKKSAGLEATFNQLIDVKSTRQVKKAQGKIWIKRPNKLRWETINPDPNILVSDGKTFWFYSPPFEKGERGQVIIKKTAQVQTQFLNMLLSGSFEFGGKTTIVEKTKNSFILTPKNGTAGDVKTAEVVINEASHKIEEVILTHTSGNKTDIKLQEIKLQPKLDDKMFQFRPDKNTDRIVE